MDGLVEGCGVGEGLMREMMRLEVVPDYAARSIAFKPMALKKV